ncbi:MAG: hypothetical protein Q9194_002624 [Teloschistes cf. exilis]
MGVDRLDVRDAQNQARKKQTFSSPAPAPAPEPTVSKSAGAESCPPYRPIDCNTP